MDELLIRPSTVQSFLLCPGRTMLSRKDGFDVVPSEALVFGSLVHWRIEQELNGVENVSYDDMIEALRAIFFEDTRKTLGIQEVAKKRFLREMINEAMVAHEAWFDDVRPQLPNTDVYTEQTLRSLIGNWDGAEIILQGTPDAVYPTAGIIVDWKTAGRAWNADKVQTQLQPIAYGLLTREQFGMEFDEFHFWVFDRSTESWYRHVAPVPGEQSVQEMQFIAQATTAAIMTKEGMELYTPSTGGFKPRNWPCSPKFCSAWSICKGKYLVDDGRADEPTPTLAEKGWRK